MSPIESVAEIINDLQKGKWADLTEQRLLSAQGKLSVYQYNIAGLVANAMQKYETMELNAKQKESEEYLRLKGQGEDTDGACKAFASLHAIKEKGDAIDAKKEYYDLRGVLDAMTAMQTAIQVQLRHFNTQRQQSKYQDNATI